MADIVPTWAKQVIVKDGELVLVSATGKFALAIRLDGDTRDVATAQRDGTLREVLLRALGVETRAAIAPRPSLAGLPVSAGRPE